VSGSATHVSTRQKICDIGVRDMWTTSSHVTRRF